MIAPTTAIVIVPPIIPFHTLAKAAAFVGKKQAQAMSRHL